MSVQIPLHVSVALSDDVLTDIDAVDLQEQARLRRERIELALLSIATGLSVFLVSCVWVAIALA